MISGYGFSHGKVVYTRAPTKKNKNVIFAILIKQNVPQ